MVIGKRFFTYDASDYFKEDMDLQEHMQNRKKEANDEEYLEGKMISQKINDRPYLYLTIHYNYTNFTMVPINTLLVECYYNA